MASEFPPEWSTLPLDDCMEAIIDYRGKTPKKSDSGVPLVTAKIVKNGRIETPEEFILHEDYESWMSRGFPRAGDVILTTEAPLGEVAQLDNHKVALAQRLICLRGKKELIDNAYLKFFFLSSVGQEELKKRATGTTVVGIRQSELRKVNVVSPPLAEQRAIAGVLGALDDKIELLGAQNRTLEAMARTLFRSWFVRFDPVPERAAGAGVLPLSPEVAALFPAALVDSALGPIPQGWRVLPLDEIADYLNGLALQKYPAQSGDEYLPVIKIAELRRGVTENSGRANLDLPAKYIVDDGDVLFSWSGSLEVVLWSGGRGALNQHLFKVTSATFPRWFYYFWTLHHLPEFQAIAASKATTMGHIQRHHLKQAKVIVPPDETLAAMGEIFSPLLERVLSNLKEARTLAALRDELLPRLLSGALRVPPEP